ncbi:S1C family serine protease [Persicobacter psychrovividus]|uniref:PEGA domain-containing protein n=1 Tax=Persicobacter psychrovividus TaxID=387638 RepID=A0ABM7VA78_9BACT|nr:hypothetical protein PEPS_01010 [Persicobacter psychrovividus]
MYKYRLNSATFILVLLIFLNSSCASIFSSRYQKTKFITPKGATVKIDGKTAKKVKGKYKVKRDNGIKEITVSKPGYKSETRSISQDYKSPVKMISLATAGACAFIPGAQAIAGVSALFMFLLDNGTKSVNYQKVVEFNRLEPLHKKQDDQKHIVINKVSIDIEDGEIEHNRYSRYKKYASNKSSESEIEDGEIKLENTIFAEALNELLVDLEYIDQSKKILASGYTENLHVNATILGITTDATRGRIGGFAGGNSNILQKATVEVEWNILDYYEQSIFRYKSKASSGEFSSTNGDHVKRMLKDAMEYNLLEFLKAPKVKSLLKKDKNIEQDFTPFDIENNIPYASNVSEVISSSVTISNKSGHGSGFIIGSDGYILTNFHVIATSDKLSVILPNGQKFTPKIIRSSKVHDLALLKIDATDLKPVKLDQQGSLAIASEIYAVGTPNAQDLAQTISKGIVSGFRENANKINLIQTDASVNHGNSGGALVNQEGVAIGVVSSKLIGIGVEGVAFGIPTNEVIDKLKLQFSDSAPKQLK